MRTLRLELPDWLAGERLAGLPVPEHWRRLLAEIRWVPGAEGPTLDGRLLGATPQEIATALDGDGPGLLRRVRPEELPDVERVWVSRRLRRLAAAGVRVVDPERIWIETTVEVAAGAVLWGGCVLRGATRIGARAVIHPGAVLDDTEVGEGAEIKAYSVCAGARIGPGCAVGPMAHLRAGTVLHGDVKVGNFVEVKAAELHPGVRASHLSYLGDAEVGAGANIGAGTITCNYDGFGKHRTEIGAGAFVGSNSSLVAPVRIGAGAIVGAGSTVTRDVPDEALMVERAEERVLEGRAPRVRAQNRARAERG
jgi:bifunctional UDP-N-acetylglucosamine pyrophosphorylase / glucosamine-1-phosphate N-acetyltransferase